MEEVSMSKQSKQRQGAGCHKSISMWKGCRAKEKKKFFLLLLDMVKITHH